VIAFLYIIKKKSNRNFHICLIGIFQNVMFPMILKQVMKFENCEKRHIYQYLLNRRWKNIPFQYTSRIRQRIASIYATWQRWTFCIKHKFVTRISNQVSISAKNNFMLNKYTFRKLYNILYLLLKTKTLMFFIDITYIILI